MSAVAEYRPQDYPAFAVSVDVALFTIRAGRLCVLLVERAAEPFAGCWALPGGFVEPDEDAGAAAWREMAEETGIAALPEGMHLEQLRTYSAPARDPRMRVVSVGHVAIAPDLPAPRAGSDAANARFWPVEDLALPGGSGEVRLAFDHEVILTDALERVRSKLEYTTLATSFVEEPFSLADLRRVYETVWGTGLDVSGFRRLVLRKDGFVVADGAPPRRGIPGRPAALYRRGPATLLHPALLRGESR